MKPITLIVSVDSDPLFDLLIQAIEKGRDVGRCQVEGATSGRIKVRTHTHDDDGRSIKARQLQMPSDEQGMLLDTRQASKLLKVSTRTLWRMYNTDEMPKPIRIERIVRWSYQAGRMKGVRHLPSNNFAVVENVHDKIALLPK